MGRWAQYRKRGTAVTLTTFPLPPPTDEQWHLEVVFGPEVIAVVDSSPGEASKWQGQYTVGGIGSPDLPWLAGPLDDLPNDLDFGGFASGRVWAHVRWLDADENPISDWSEPQFIDVA